MFSEDSESTYVVFTYVKVEHQYTQPTPSWQNPIPNWPEVKSVIPSSSKRGTQRIEGNYQRIPYEKSTVYRLSFLSFGLRVWVKTGFFFLMSWTEWVKRLSTRFQTSYSISVITTTFGIWQVPSGNGCLISVAVSSVVRIKVQIQTRTIGCWGQYRRTGVVAGSGYKSLSLQDTRPLRYSPPNITISSFLTLLLE